MVNHHRQFRGLEIGLFYFILNALFLINEKQLNEMNIFQKDEIGLPSTFAAILANVFQAIDLMNVNIFLTIIISLLSIVWLVFKIKNEKAIFEKRKDEKGE